MVPLLFEINRRFVLFGTRAGHGKRGVHHFRQEEVRAGRVARRCTQVGSAARGFGPRLRFVALTLAGLRALLLAPMMIIIGQGCVAMAS